MGLGHAVTAAEAACDATIAASALEAEPPPEMLLAFTVVNRPSRVADCPVPPEGGGVYQYQRTSCAHWQALISAVTSACGTRRLHTKLFSRTAQEKQTLQPAPPRGSRRHEPQRASNLRSELSVGLP